MKLEFYENENTKNRYWFNEFLYEDLFPSDVISFNIGRFCIGFLLKFFSELLFFIMTIAVNKHKGFEIYMNFNKINDSYYPHFEVVYKNTVSKFAIDLSVIELSNLPVDIANEVIDWAFDNHDELLKLWAKLIEKQIGKHEYNYAKQVN